MRIVGTFLRTVASRFLLLLVMIIAFIPTILFFCMPSRWRYKSRFFFCYIDLIYRAILKCSLLQVEFVGLENIPKNVPVIFASNHQSSFDIPLIGRLTKGAPHVWLALKDLMKSSILRFILPRLSVLVDPSSPWRAVRSLLQVMDLVKGKNIHIMIFPEGGRYTDGKVHDFFGGFAILAKRMGRPVVPVFIHNVQKVYPPNSFLVHWYPIKVVVGKPFVFKDGESDEAFKNKVYQWFIKESKQQV